MQQKHEIWPKTIQQWWHETYILPSEVHKLITPQTCSLAHKTPSFQNVPPNNKTIAENKTYNLPSGHQVNGSPKQALCIQNTITYEKVTL